MNIDFKKFRKDFSIAVKQLEEQYGLTIEPANIGYSDDNFTMKVICKKPINTNVSIAKDDWFTKIGGRQNLIVHEVNGDNIKLFVKGKFNGGMYNMTKKELLTYYSKI